MRDLYRYCTNEIKESADDFINLCRDDKEKKFIKWTYYLEETITIVKLAYNLYDGLILFYHGDNDDKNIFNTSFLANKSVRDIMKRPVDIVVGTNSRFQKFGKSKDSLMIEGEVQRNGILLYDSAGAAN